MSTALTFTFSLDPAEQVRVIALVARRTGGGRLWRWVGLTFLAVPLLVALAFDWPLTILWPYLLVLALVGLLSLLLPLIQRWQVKRAFARAPSLQGPLTYEFTEKTLALRTPISSAEFVWEALVEAIETDDLFVLFFPGPLAYYLPKRAVGPQAAALGQFLRSRLGPRAAGIGSGPDFAVT